MEAADDVAVVPGVRNAGLAKGLAERDRAILIGQALRVAEYSITSSALAMVSRQTLGPPLEGVPADSFKYLGSAGEERRRDRHAERLRSLEVDNQLVFGRRLYR
jgi:hypothetical protein